MSALIVLKHHYDSHILLISTINKKNSKDSYAYTRMVIVLYKLSTVVFKM